MYPRFRSLRSCLAWFARDMGHKYPWVSSGLLLFLCLDTESQAPVLQESEDVEASGVCRPISSWLHFMFVTNIMYYTTFEIQAFLSPKIFSSLSRFKLPPRPVLTQGQARLLPRPMTRFMASFSCAYGCPYSLLHVMLCCLHTLYVARVHLETTRDVCWARTTAAFLCFTTHNTRCANDDPFYSAPRILVVLFCAFLCFFMCFCSTP